MLLKECTRTNLCRDCDDIGCVLAGEIMPDCPRLDCINDPPHDCEDCAWLKQYIKEIKNTEEIGWVVQETVMEDPVHMMKRWWTREYGNDSQTADELVRKMRP